MRDSTHTQAPPAGVPVAKLALLVALLVAAVVRLARLDLAPFCVDQVSVLRMVEGILDGRHFPRRGPDIGPGLFEWGTLGPLEYYVMTPLVAITRPLAGPVRGPLIAFVLLGLTSFPSLFRLGERHLGRGVGAIACLLYATSPYPFFLSRELMDHSFLAPVVPLFFLALAEVLESRSLGWAVVACASLAAAMQFHITTIVFFPILVAVLAGARLAPRAWLAGLLAGAAIYTPFLHAQITEGFPDLRAMLSVATGDSVGVAPERAGATVLALLHQILYRTGQTPDIDTPRWVHQVGAATSALVALGVLLAAAGAVRGALGAKHERARAAKLAVIAAWLVAPVAFLWTQRSEVYARHLAVVYPAPQLLAALAVGWLAFGAGWRALGRAERVARVPLAVVSLAIASAAAASGCWTIHRFQQAVETGFLVAGKLALGPEQSIADALARHGVLPSAFDQVALAGGGQELEGIYYMLERATPRTADAATRPAAPPNRFLVVAPTDVLDDAVLHFLESLGWRGGLALFEHRRSLAPETIRVFRDGERVERQDLTSYGSGEPGSIRVEGTVTKHDGERILLVLDTHVCIERVTVADVVAYQADCAGAPALPWPVRSGFEVPTALPAGEHPLRIDGSNPAKRLFLSLFDVTVPAAGLPRAAAPSTLDVIPLDPS